MQFVPDELMWFDNTLVASCMALEEITDGRYKRTIHLIAC
jgi:hypothetical protein